MLFANDKSNHYKTINSTCYIANIAYLILRAFYLILFIISGLYVMVWITIGTIVIYLLCFLLIKKKKYYLYALVCGNEFFAFIIASTLILGFNTGFHFYLIGLSVVSFFTSYFSRYNNIKGSIVWAGLSLIIYLTLFFVTKYNAPYYVITDWLQTTLFVTHVAVVFLFVVFYLVIFIKYALSLERRIINESRTDELTQINNRYGLYDYFNETMNKDSKVLALFDIDNFKEINDHHGHVTGDYVLKKVAEITSNVLNGSFVCRFGGEEFIMVLDKEGHLERLEELRKSIEKEVFEYEGEKVNLTVTIGVAPYLKDMSLEKWIDDADTKMYLGKKSGKNKVVS